MHLDNKAACRLLVALFLLFLLSSCKDEKRFKLQDPDYTGITFQNNISSPDSLNILHYLYYYNGGGVAIGDINNDGLEDIYFTSNQESNKLYLNKGNFRFEDITAKAHVQGNGNWKTGVTMADVNADGLLDIYVSEVGQYKNLKGRNELFINNGDLSFTERAAEYGLDIEGFNTQSTFFDYDKDGDLDMFLVNHSVHSTETFADASIRETHADVSGDKLFRNDRDSNKITFTEVTEQAGIYNSAIGYGLNVIIADFNNDHWDDIYVSNDFHENDYYYINLKNGSFREINKDAFGHQSRFSMGSDAGDINNDGWIDLITLDMLPADEKILKSSVSDDAPDVYLWKVDYGYHHQLSRNCLQLNVDGGRRFSDIALYAGVAATDWSWSPLLADFDNDGMKDLFITNGITKRPNDLDYLKFISSPAISAALNSGQSADSITIEKMPPGKVSNVIYKCTPDLIFQDQTAAWGMDRATLSNGAAYGDLDNDGDLDLVTNDINEAAHLYRNDNNNQSKNHFLDIHLVGTGDNIFAYGAKVLIRHHSQLQMNYVTASRGFQSSSTLLMHFGLGSDLKADMIQIIWPDQRVQILTNVAADQRLIVHQEEAIPASGTLLPVGDDAESGLFVDVTKEINLDYSHIENNYIDFNSQSLIPHQFSSIGPKVAVADVNNDGLDDFFICGATNQPGNLFLQTVTGSFTKTNEAVFAGDAFAEDVNAVFFDADNDGDSDLYVVSGGNERSGPDPALPDRMYKNDGKGNFKKATIPAIFENKAVAAPADVDHDGDIDLFIGGAVVAGNYGAIPGSYLLINDGKGNFTVGARAHAPGLHDIGMVTDAVWSDFDKDGWMDLIIVGEWMPVSVFRNVNGVLKNITTELNLQATSGLWTTIHAADIDNNGYPDLLVGNRGENSKLLATNQFPLKLQVSDLDQNGLPDQILSVNKKNKYYPFLGKEVLEKQLPFIRKKYAGYADFAGKTVEEIFGKEISGTRTFFANTLSTMLFKNEHGKFSPSALPKEIQWSPVFAFFTADFNRDGKTDILSAGNFYGVTPFEGRYDAGYGHLLLQGDTAFKSLYPLRSGFRPDGQVRDIKKLRSVNNRSLYLVARNNNNILFYVNEAFP